MDITENIINFYDRLELRFRDLFLEVLNNFSEKSVHDFRVAIKKLNAFFHLLGGIDPGFKVEEAEALFLNIFKNAGAIRKVHVEKNILTNKDLAIKLNALLLENLAIRLGKKTGKFLKQQPAKDLEAILENGKLTRTRIKTISQNELNSGLGNYFSKLLQDLRSLSGLCKSSEEAFHDLRKLLKELFYNLFLINELFEKRQLSPDVLKYLDKLQTSLGEWHDIHLALKHFSKPEYLDFIQLTKILKQKHGRYIKRIRKQLTAFEELISKIEMEVTALVR